MNIYLVFLLFLDRPPCHLLIKASVFSLRCVCFRRKKFHRLHMSEADVSHFVFLVPPNLPVLFYVFCTVDFDTIM